LPGRDMIPRQNRKGRENNKPDPGRPEFKERRSLDRRFCKSATGKPPLLDLTCNVITTAMSCDPAIASIQELVHAGQPRECNKGPGPPDLAAEKNHGICTTDVAAVAGQDAHLFQRRARLEIEPLHYPVCLQPEKKETAAAKYSFESFRSAGTGSAIAIV